MKKGKAKFGLLALILAFGAVFAATQVAPSVQAQAPAKTCTAGTTAGTATCTLSVTLNGGITSIAISAPTGAMYAAAPVVTASTGGVAVVGPTPPATAFPAPSYDVACAAVAPATCTATISESISTLGTATSVTQTGSVATLFTVTAAVPAVTTTTTTTSILGPAPTITATCSLPTTTTGATPTPVTTVQASSTAQTVNCTIDLNDSDAAPSTVASGTLTITVAGPSGVTVAGSTVPAGNTIAVHCGATVGNESCDNVALTVNIPAAVAPLPATVTIHVQYAPDPGTTANSPTGADLTLFTIVQAVAGFVQPAGIVIQCPSTLNPNLATLPTLFPIQLGTGPGTPIAFGILPQALVCQVVPVDATGAVITSGVAPGTIEVSTVNGTLIDASGRLDTNLRIPCGQPVNVTIGTAINFNTCTGVQFAVTNLGVGIVNLVARYEPSSVAAAAGIQERETTASVAFVAPPVSVNLLLDPNPVAVNQTGTATARFNRTFLLCGVGIFCVNPTTGAPILFNAATVLNGNVVFNIDNTAIARWAAAAPTATAPVPSSTAGFQTTANQTVARCGFFSTTTNPSVLSGTTFSSFFGGCESASAQYVGVAPGTTNVSATFVPDLPGAGTQFAPFFPGQFSGVSNPTATVALSVTGVAPTGNVQLVRGCNNITPTVTEDAATYAKRIDPAAALVALWEYQAGTNTFKGWSPQAGAPNDLTTVTRLKPIFICVSSAATLSQPPA